MDLGQYKRRLLDAERELSARIERNVARGREPGDDAVHDASDESVTDESKEATFSVAEADRETLTQVRDALNRIDAGTFGACVVDGGPIEKERLDAVPWTPFCLRHQELREAAGPRRTPTL
jgi:DnaK suppressor protein